jgi:hypothetical protein
MLMLLLNRWMMLMEIDGTCQNLQHAIVELFLDRIDDEALQQPADNRQRNQTKQ